ncbi:MAG: hypothetical protein ACREJM_01230 [Candidatus Saccharimonadales bacterium]
MHRHITAHEAHDAAVHPFAQGLRVDVFQRKPQLAVRLELHEDGHDVHVVLEHDVLHGLISGHGEAKHDVGQFRLDLEGRLPGAGHDARRYFDAIGKAIR